MKNGMIECWPTKQTPRVAPSRLSPVQRGTRVGDGRGAPKFLVRGMKAQGARLGYALPDRRALVERLEQKLQGNKVKIGEHLGFMFSFSDLTRLIVTTFLGLSSNLASSH